MTDQPRQAAIRLQALATRLLRLARSANAAEGIGSAQYSALATLYERGSMSVVELARSERVSHPTMSRIVAGLNRAGAVSRTAKPSDRRSRTVELTDRGRELYEKICANRTALTAAILDQLSPTAAAEVLAAVERVARAVEEKRPPA